jgi:hypothetical protein
MTGPALIAPADARLVAVMPGPTDRAVFIGQTGSGKTTFARVVMEQRPYAVAYDPKGMLSWKGWQLYRSFDRMSNDRAIPPRVIYRPSYDELEDKEQIDDFFAWIYRRGNTTVYVDELYAIAQGDNYPYHYGACLTRGRELGISVFSATQRPSRVPQATLSESEHYYVFRLKLPQDRKRVAEITGLDETEIRQLRGHRFLYAPQTGDPTGPHTLALTR